MCWACAYSTNIGVHRSKWCSRLLHNLNTPSCTYMSLCCCWRWTETKSVKRIGTMKEINLPWLRSVPTSHPAWPCDSWTGGTCLRFWHLRQYSSHCQSNSWVSSERRSIRNAFKAHFTMLLNYVDGSNVSQMNSAHVQIAKAHVSKTRASSAIGYREEPCHKCSKDDDLQQIAISKFAQTPHSLRQRKKYAGVDCQNKRVFKPFDKGSS